MRVLKPRRVLAPHEFMATPDGSGPAQTRRSTWRRDYRLSLVLLGSGIVLVVALLLYEIWMAWTGNGPTSFEAGVAFEAPGAAGVGLILFAGTVAYYHRAGLR